MGLFPERTLAWLQVIEPTPAEQNRIRFWQPRLGVGEASSLVLALQRNATLATDDRRARAWALQQGIAVTGTIGLLMGILNRQLIDLLEADDILQQMVRLGYYSPIRSLRELQE